MGTDNSGCYAEVNSGGYANAPYNSRYMSAMGERLKSRRKEVGLSQAALAKAAGVKQSTISYIENGRNKGSQYVAQIATALRLSPTWLATGKGPKEPAGSVIDSDDPDRAKDAKEGILLHLYRGLFSLQQERLIASLRALFDANQITRRELGNKSLRGVSDEEVLSAFGEAPFHRMKQHRRKVPPHRDPGTALDDFLGEP
jgi:transcriptional regulator with XRE-family HTH domain